MIKRILMALAVAALLMSSTFVFAEEAASTEGSSVSVGGLIKMTLFDRPVSTVRNAGAQTSIEKSYGIGFKELSLFLAIKINDWVSFEVDPKFSASSGATPKFGVTKTVTSGSEFSFSGFGHGKAAMILKLPYDINLEVGQIYPKFTAEYGHELFWDESINGGIFALNSLVGSFHDSGIEISKIFEISEVSFPVYAYILNGGTATGAYDINNQPGAMIHVEPVWKGLTLLGSIYSMKTDAKELKATTGWATGLMYSWENLSIRTEFVRTKQERYVNGKDSNTEGYYVKLMYKVLPWFKLYAMHESAYSNFTSSTNATPTRALGVTPGFDIYLADSTSLQFQCDVQNWTNSTGTSTLIVTRPTLAVRSIF